MAAQMRSRAERPASVGRDESGFPGIPTETGGLPWRELLLGGAVPLVLIGVIAFADILEGPKTAFIGVLAFVPMFAAVFARPLITAGVGALTWLSALLFGVLASDGNVPAQRVRLVIIALCSVIAIAAAAIRTRTDRALAAARLAAAEADFSRQQADEALEREQRLDRDRRLRDELLRDAQERLDVDSGGADPLDLLVELLVPQFADVASVESLATPGGVLAAAGGVGESHGDLQNAERLESEFHAGAAGPVRLDLGRSTEGRGGFDETDRQFLELLTQRVAVGIARRELRDGQRRISWELQHALLPTALTEAPGVEVCGTYLAAGEMLDVGGDWYDSMLLPDGRLLLVVGDVVGHSLEAAAVMGRLRFGLAALSTLISRPGDLLVALDGFAQSAAAGTGFATVACAALDPSSGELEYASAGHPPMLLIGPDGSFRWLDGGRSVPLCTYQPPHRPSATETLAAGTTLVLYTDGLVERRFEPIDDGLQRLADAAVALRGRVGEVLSQELVRELGMDDQLQDDVAVLTVKYRGDLPAPWHLRQPAEAVTLPELRRQARGWLEAIDAAPECVGDILLVLTEACSNVIDHAYVNRPRGTYSATLSLAAPDELMIEVVDQGAWRQPGLHSTGRGKGAALVESLSSSVRRHSDDDGTTLTVLMKLRYASAGPELHERPPKCPGVGDG